MKNKFTLALAALCLCASVVQLSAQTTVVTGPGGATTTTAPTQQTIPSFFNTAMEWGTSFDTNKSWAPITGQFEDGYAQANGTGAANFIRGQYDIGRWNATLEGQFFGVGSAFNGFEAGGGFALIQRYDFKAEANILAGGQKLAGSDSMQFKAEGEIKLTKLMTANTYWTVSLGIPYVQSQKFDGTPCFRTGFGFVF